MPFDLSHERSVLLGDCGCQFYLARNLEQSKSVGGLGSSADAYINMAVQSLLAGLDEPAVQLLKKARQWLDVAVAEDEKPQRYSRNATEASRFHTLAMCNWLLHGQHDAASLKQFVTHEDQYLATSAAGKDKVEVSFVLPVYVDAGAFNRVLESFNATPGLSVPKSIGTMRNEAQMAYVLSCHRLALQFEAKDVEDATKKFLTKNMDHWLSNGHFIRAAEWTKIAYWNGNEERFSPKQVVMKCLDHLPNCRPLS
jgi:hypothetical protein